MTQLDEPTLLDWEAHPLRELARLAWPMVISLLSFSLITLVDTLFIGRLGAVELAAAGLGGVCAFTVASFGLATFSAAKVLVSEDHGRGERSEIGRALGAFLRLAAVLSVVSVFSGGLLALCLPLVSAHEETGIQAGHYLALRSLGLPFILVSSAIGQWLSAQGDSKSAMRAALVANAANVPLNAFLIFGLGWGLVGAAVASVLSVVLEALWLIKLQHQGVTIQGASHQLSRGFYLKESDWTAARDALSRGLATGVERVLDMLAFAAVPLLLSQLGPVDVAAHQIVLQVMLLSFLPGLAVSEALSVLIAQAVGAERPILVRQLTQLGLAVAMVYAFVCALVTLAASRGIVSFFTPDPEVLRVGKATLVVASVLQFINMAYVQLKGVLRGLSQFRYVAWVTVACAWSITPPLTYLLGVVMDLGAPGAWMTLCIEVSIGFGFLALRLRSLPMMKLPSPS